jgi:hypothetical protein
MKSFDDRYPFLNDWSVSRSFTQGGVLCLEKDMISS